MFRAVLCRRSLVSMPARVPAVRCAATSLRAATAAIIRIPARGMAKGGKGGKDKPIQNKNKREVETISSYDLNTCKTAMADAVAHYKNELNSIRAGGRATAEQLSDISVRAYGNPTPLHALGTIATRSAQALIITPHDPSLTKEIIVAIKTCGKELTASEDGGGGGATGTGKGILVQFPKSSKEIRDQLIKLAKTKAEETRTRIKRVHGDSRSQLKKIEGMGKDDVYKLDQGIQKATEDANKQVKTLLDAKEKELATL